MTTDPADMGEVVGRVKGYAMAADDKAKDLTNIAGAARGVAYNSNKAADIHSLLAHLASLEAENKALREEVKALAICPQFVAADKITMHGPSTTYPSRTAANHVRATITRLLTEIERIAGA